MKLLIKRNYLSVIAVMFTAVSIVSFVVVASAQQNFAVFRYQVASNDNLTSIAQHYGLNAADIRKFNNITNVSQGMNILLQFHDDVIKTDVPLLGRLQNAYDYYILEYAVQFHLNPMLIKAEVYDESVFNTTAISRLDSPPGVCGTGHSYGLLQYTTTCLPNSTYGIAKTDKPNAMVLRGFDGQPAAIQCIGKCANGTYFVNETSLPEHKQITSILVSNTSSPAWNNSLFNPRLNLYYSMQLESGRLAAIKDNINMCSYAQYNRLALEAYQQPIYSSTINNCNSMNSNAAQYADQVIGIYYSNLTKYASYGWHDEYG